jgi:hypothetical protein
MVGNGKYDMDGIMSNGKKVGCTGRKEEVNK